MDIIKYLWVQSGGGDFHIGSDENGNKIVTEFKCEFNPQKISLLPGAPEKADYSMEYFDYVPKGIVLNTSGGIIIEYTDDIEKVRKKWYEIMISHYKHLQWISDLITLSPDWELEMSKIVIQAEAHRAEYPELWV